MDTSYNSLFNQNHFHKHRFCDGVFLKKKYFKRFPYVTSIVYHVKRGRMKSQDFLLTDHNKDIEIAFVM